jgi:hypothetical protein
MEQFNNVSVGTSIEKIREERTENGIYELYLLSINYLTSYVVYISDGRGGATAQFSLEEAQMNELFDTMHRCELDHEHLIDVSIDHMVSLNL